MTVREMYDFMKKMIDEGYEDSLVTYDYGNNGTCPPDEACVFKGFNDKFYVDVS